MAIDLFKSAHLKKSSGPSFILAWVFFFGSSLVGGFTAFIVLPYQAVKPFTVFPIVVLDFLLKPYFLQNRFQDLLFIKSLPLGRHGLFPHIMANSIRTAVLSNLNIVFSGILLGDFLVTLLHPLAIPATLTWVFIGLVFVQLNSFVVKGTKLAYTLRGVGRRTAWVVYSTASLVYFASFCFVFLTNSPTLAFFTCGMGLTLLIVYFKKVPQVLYMEFTNRFTSSVNMMNNSVQNIYVLDALYFFRQKSVFYSMVYLNGLFFLMVFLQDFDGSVLKRLPAYMLALCLTIGIASTWVLTSFANKYSYWSIFHVQPIPIQKLIVQPFITGLCLSLGSALAVLALLQILRISENVLGDLSVVLLFYALLIYPVYFPMAMVKPQKNFFNTPGRPNKQTVLKSLAYIPILSVPIALFFSFPPSTWGIPVPYSLAGICILSCLLYPCLLLKVFPALMKKQKYIFAQTAVS